MFGTKKTGSKGKKTPFPRRLQMETLEGRQMMTTTTLVLDFTPDYRSGNLVETFNNTRYSNGAIPKFLDFNGDNRLTQADVSIAANQIKNAVSNFMAGAARGYDVRVVHSDVLSNTNFGARYLKYGQQTRNQQVLVMYVGGRNRGEFGIAPIARPGYNVEGFAQTYSQTIANHMMRIPNATSAQFAWQVGATAAHEFGHMLGLQHSQNKFVNDLMNPAQTNTPSTSQFSIYNQKVVGGIQNAVAELRRSFAGQPTYYANTNYGSRAEAPDHHHDDHTDSDHEFLPASLPDVYAEQLSAITALVKPMTGSRVEFLGKESHSTFNPDNVFEQFDRESKDEEPIVGLVASSTSTNVPQAIKFVTKSAQTDATASSDGLIAHSKKSEQADQFFAQFGLEDGKGLFN